MTFLILIALFATQRPEVGNIVELRGEVIHSPPPGNLTPARLDAPVFIYDIVETGERSTVTIEFVDGTPFGMSENTWAQISTAQFDPDRAPPEIRVALARGAIETSETSTPLTVQPVKADLKTPAGPPVTLKPGESAHLRLEEDGTLKRLPPSGELPDLRKLLPPETWLRFEMLPPQQDGDEVAPEPAEAEEEEPLHLWDPRPDENPVELPLEAETGLSIRPEEQED